MAITTQHTQEALDRATGNNSTANYGAIYDGFTAKGIAPEEIKPRENVFTYEAWKALGRYVKRGEHGVKVFTYIPTREERDDSGNVTRQAGKRFKAATVFHISQTDKF